MPVKGLMKFDQLTTPYELWYDQKPKIKKFRVFGCPAVFKKYGNNSSWIQQGNRGTFIGFPEKQAGWAFYSAADTKKKLHPSLDAFFR